MRGRRDGLQTEPLRPARTSTGASPLHSSLTTTFFATGKNAASSDPRGEAAVPVSCRSCSCFPLSMSRQKLKATLT